MRHQPSVPLTFPIVMTVLAVAMAVLAFLARSPWDLAAAAGIFVGPWLIVCLDRR